MATTPSLVKTTVDTKVVATHAADPAELKTHIQLIKQVQRDVMKEHVHFGKIPGTPKPTLYKAGAEVLCATFRIAPTYDSEDLSNEDMIRYRVTCRGTHQNTGILLGDGVGECSTMEEKYKWRKAGDREFEATPENRRRIKFARGRDGEYEVKQVRTEPYDLANTVLKMAAKRAQVAMTLNVLAASDMFAQDLEDGPTGLSDDYEQPQSRSRPQASNNSNGTITDKQKKLLLAKLMNAKLDDSGLCKFMDVTSLEEINFQDMNKALKWIEDNDVPFE